MELKRIALPIAIISVSVGAIIASLEAQMIYKYGSAMGSPSILEASVGALVWALVVAFLYLIASKLFYIEYIKAAFVILTSFFISFEYPGFFRISLKQAAVDNWNMSSVGFNLAFEGTFVTSMIALFIADRTLISRRKRQKSAARDNSA